MRRVKEENTLVLISILVSFSIKHQIRRQYQLIFFFNLHLGSLSSKLL